MRLALQQCRGSLTRTIGTAASRLPLHLTQAEMAVAFFEGPGRTVKMSSLSSAATSLLNPPHRTQVLTARLDTSLLTPPHRVQVLTARLDNGDGLFSLFVDGALAGRVPGPIQTNVSTFSHFIGALHDPVWPTADCEIHSGVME